MKYEDKDKKELKDDYNACLRISKNSKKIRVGREI
jgi:hypothetical protein